MYEFNPNVLLFGEERPLVDALREHIYNYESWTQVTKSCPLFNIIYYRDCMVEDMDCADCPFNYTEYIMENTYKLC